MRDIDQNAHLQNRPQPTKQHYKNVRDLALKIAQYNRYSNIVKNVSHLECRPKNHLTPCPADNSGHPNGGFLFFDKGKETRKSG
ncbi:MAG TPA: hypothetical protein VLF09_14385 [Cellvibrio sp.]|nr:hypothetical protein [Cellvibrio sp.]